MGLREDVGNSRFLVDTSPLIYFVEKHARRHGIVGPLFAAVDRGETECLASVLTLVEVLVLPLRLGRIDLAEAYEEILTRSVNVRACEVTLAVARQAARVRAAHGLRTPDAIIVATALAHGVSAIVTNDRAFQRIPGIRVLVVDDYSGVPAP